MKSYLGGPWTPWVSFEDISLLLQEASSVLTGLGGGWNSCIHFPLPNPVRAEEASGEEEAKRLQRRPRESSWLLGRGKKKRLRDNQAWMAETGGSRDRRSLGKRLPGGRSLPGHPKPRIAASRGPKRGRDSGAPRGLQRPVEAPPALEASNKGARGKGGSADAPGPPLPGNRRLPLAGLLSSGCRPREPAGEGGAAAEASFPPGTEEPRAPLRMAGRAEVSAGSPRKPSAALWLPSPRFPPRESPPPPARPPASLRGHERRLSARFSPGRAGAFWAPNRRAGPLRSR